MKWFSKLITEIRLYPKEVYGFFKNNKLVTRTFIGLLLLIILISTHYKFYNSTFIDDKTFINNLFVAIFQITGGLLIIVSIAGNMDSVAKKRLIDPIRIQLKNFPKPFRERSLVKEKNTVSVDVAWGIEASGRETLEGIEERVKFLEIEIERIRSDMTKDKNDMQKKFEVFNTNLNDLKNEIENIKNKLEISVTSVEMEVIGILFIGYGIVIPVVFN